MYQTVFFSMLLQLVLASFAMASPIGTEMVHQNAWQYGGAGVLGFIVFILDIIVFVEVLQSNRMISHKLLWCVLVFLFPVGGLIIYWLFSNRQAHKSGGGYEAIA